MSVKTNIMVTVVGGSIQNKPQPYASLLLKYQRGSGWTLLQSHSDKTKMCMCLSTDYGSAVEYESGMAE